MNPLLISDDLYENQLQDEHDAARAWVVTCEHYQRRHPLSWSGEPHSVSLEDILEFGVHDLDAAHLDASVKLQRLRAQGKNHAIT